MSENCWLLVACLGTGTRSKDLVVLIFAASSFDVVFERQQAGNKNLLGSEDDKNFWIFQLVGHQSRARP